MFRILGTTAAMHDAVARRAGDFDATLASQARWELNWAQTRA